MNTRFVIAQIAFVVLIGPYANSEETPRVKNASEAMEASLHYLRARNSQIAPDAHIQWQEKTIYSDGPIDLVTTSKQFTSDAWIIEAHQSLAPLRKIEYRVIVFSPTLGWHWKGSITADGGIREESDFKLLSSQEKDKMTEELLRKSRIRAPTGGYGH